MLRIPLKMDLVIRLFVVGLADLYACGRDL